MCFKREDSDNSMSWKCSRIISPYSKVMLLLRLVLKKLYLWWAFVHPKLTAETKRYNVNSCKLDLITVLCLDLFTCAVPHWFLKMRIIGLHEDHSVVAQHFFSSDHKIWFISAVTFIKCWSLAVETLVMTWPVKLALGINRTKIAMRKKFILCQINNPIPFQWIRCCGALKTGFTVSVIERFLEKMFRRY